MEMSLRSLRRIWKLMALFFSCSLSIPQGVLISLNNLTFSSMLCFLSYKQMLCLPLYDTQHQLYIEKKVRQIMLFPPSILDLTLIVLVWPAAWLTSRFLAEYFEVGVKPSPRDFFCVCSATRWSWLTVCFGFFLFSPEVVKTLLSEVSGILLWSLQSFFH